MTAKQHPVQVEFLNRYNAATGFARSIVYMEAPFVDKRGNKVEEPVYVAPKSAYRLVKASCSRCGGQGGADAWKHTGYTCFKCGGDGGHHMARETVYTLEEFAKRQAKAEAKRVALLAKEAAARDAAKATFEQSHADLIAKVNRLTHPSAFLTDVMSKGWMFGKLSDAQARAANDAADREFVRQQQNQGCQWLGKVGERITVTGTVIFHTAFDGAFGTVHVTGIKTDEGHIIVQKGASLKKIFRGKNECGAMATTYHVVEKGDRVTLTATVKEHSTRDGVKQTLIERPTVKEIA